MFKYNTNDINLDNTYEVLIENNRLLELQHEIEKLDYDQQVELASGLVLGCPARQLTALFEGLDSLKNKTVESFYYKANQALLVRTSIMKILDSKNEAPSSFFAAPDYPDLYNQYHFLSTTLMNKDAIKLVSELVNKTDNRKLNHLARNINEAFERSYFSNVFQEALSLKHLLNTLNSKEAYLMFSDPEFRTTLFTKFSEITAAQISDVQTIGNNLAKCVEEPTKDCYLDTVRGIDELCGAFNDSSCTNDDLKANLESLKKCFYQAVDAMEQSESNEKAEPEKQQNYQRDFSKHNNFFFKKHDAPQNSHDNFQAYTFQH